MGSRQEFARAKRRVDLSPFSNAAHARTVGRRGARSTCSERLGCPLHSAVSTNAAAHYTWREGFVMDIAIDDVPRVAAVSTFVSARSKRPRTIDTTYSQVHSGARAHSRDTMDLRGSDMPPSSSSLSFAMLGGLAALGSAAAWAVGSVLFRRLGDEVSPLGLNLAKGALGLLFLGAVLAVVGVEPIGSESLGYLAASGLVGIALGDTLFFMALVRLEPRSTLLLATLGQVFTVVLALLLLGERPAALAWPGMVLVIGGVTWVMRERQQGETPDVTRERRLGIVYGLLASLCMAAGILLTKVGVETVPALQATFLRLAAGVLGLLVVGVATRRIGGWLAPFRSIRLIRSMSVAVAVIVFGGFYLSVLALKLADASVATVLNATEPLFILPLAAFALRERVSLRAFLGAAIAVAGVAVVLGSLA